MFILQQKTWKYASFQEKLYVILIMHNIAYLMGQIIVPGDVKDVFRKHSKSQNVRPT